MEYSLAYQTRPHVEKYAEIVIEPLAEIKDCRGYFIESNKKDSIKKGQEEYYPVGVEIVLDASEYNSQYNQS